MGVPNTSYPVNCSSFTVSQFERLTIARGAAGAVSVFVCCMVLLLIAVKRGYTSVLQRFLLYLTLATIFVLSSYVMQLERLANYAWQREVCAAVGFIDQWGGVMVLILSMEITVVLVCRVYRSVYGHFLNAITRTQFRRRVLETAAVCVAVAASLAGAVVPFSTQTYGLSGAWCWIIAIDDNCKDTGGYWQQIALWYIPVTVFGVLIGICIVSIVLFFCIMNCHPVYGHILTCTLVKDNILLLGFYFFFFLANGSDYYRLYTGVSHNYGNYQWWQISAIVPAIARLFLPVGYLVYMYSFKTSTFKRFWQRCRDQNEPYAAMHENEDATFKTSHPRQYPSETVIYTGAFPSILSHTNQERQPLMSAGKDTGYSSA